MAFRTFGLGAHKFQVKSVVVRGNPVLSAHVEWLVQEMHRKEKYP
jgi:hypothetical protein